MCKNKPMETLINEIKRFLKKTGMPACELANKAGVANSIISRILNGKQSNITLFNANALRRAMQDLETKDTHNAT